MSIRIGLIAVQHESNPRSPFLTTLEDFRRGSLVADGQVVERWRSSRHEIAGVIHASEEQRDAELVPLLAAWAVPGGTVERAAFDYLREAVRQHVLRASDCDALIVCLHGAMVASGAPDADGVLLELIRQHWPSKPLVATVDFHANITEQMVRHCDVLVAYRTNPHVDQFEVGWRAWRHAVSLAGGTRHAGGWVTVVRHPACLISISCQNTGMHPWPELYAELQRHAASLGAMEANLCAGFPFADLFEAGPSVTVTGPAKHRAQLEDCAEVIAQQVFERRHELYRTLLPPHEVPRALSAERRPPVILVDFGDNVGGGAPGDGTLLLHILAAARVPGVVACLWDPELVHRCRERQGEEVHDTAGGRCLKGMGEPLRFVGQVASFSEGRWHEPEVRHGGLSHYDQGPTVLVRPHRVLAQPSGDGTGEWQSVEDWSIVVNSFRTPPFSLGQLTSAGVDPRRAHVIIVKAAVAYRAAYEPIAGDIIEVETPGPTANDVRLLPPPSPDASEPFVSLRRPIYPLDPL